MKLLLFFLGPAFASAADTTITGLVVDTGCYLSHNTKGPQHIKCATMCANGGVPLAILDETCGKVYLPIAVDHKNQNAK